MQLSDITKAMKLLESYKGTNGYIIDLKNKFFAYKNISLTDFQCEFICRNYDFAPKFIHKIVKIAPWFGEKMKEKYNFDFTPKVLEMGWYMGDTESCYVFYGRFRKSQEKNELIVCSKKAIWTDFLAEDYTKLEVDFEKYNSSSTITLLPHQEESIKFLLSRKKAILSLEMGLGKTISAIVAALEGQFKKILVVCPASIKTTWKRELEYYVKPEEITIVEGSNWKENKFTIINYDILDNFYTIPTEKVVRKVKEIDEAGHLRWKNVEKEVKSRKKTVINSAMKDSQLFTSNFDLIIIDEIHRLSNNTSIRYKVIDDLINRSKPIAIFGLTGTMVTNKPINLYNVLKIIGCPIANDWQEFVVKYCDGKSFYNKPQRDYYTKQYLHRVQKPDWYSLTDKQKDELKAYLDKNCKKFWVTDGSSNLDELAERIKTCYFRKTNADLHTTIKKEVKLIEYEMNPDEKQEYIQAWDKFVGEKLNGGDDIQNLLKYKSLIEKSVIRQQTSRMMIPHTCQLVEELVNKGEKVIVACNFDEEVYTIEEYFGDKAVVYNGKLLAKQKDKAIDKFLNDDSCQVFIGNIQAASVGLTLIKSCNMVFNSVSFVPSDNEQMEFRILRIGQKRDCTIYYQSIKDTYIEHIFKLLGVKNNIISQIIK